MQYNPPQEILDWFTRLIMMVKDGGTWAVPQNQSIYTLHHSKKEIHHMIGPNDEWHQKNAICFEKLGWKMVEFVV